MRFLVDADACPVTAEVEKLAKEKGCPCILFHDYNHTIQSDYSEVRIIDAGKDAVDFAIVAECQSGDIVITNDAGLASMVLAKAECVINFYGHRYTEAAIDERLLRSHMAKQYRYTHNYRNMPKSKKHGRRSNFQHFGKSLAACL